MRPFRAPLSLALAALLALAAAAGLLAFGPGAAAPGGDLQDELRLATGSPGAPARVVEVREQDLPQTVHGAGRVVFDDQRVAHVLPPVAGRVTRLFAALGDRVAKGAPLLAIDSPEAGSASSDLAKAAADLAQARAETARQRRLDAAGATSRRELEAAEDALRRAEAEEARAGEKARLLGGGRPGVAQEVVVRSPIAGAVVARAASPGLELQGSWSGGSPPEVFTVGDTSRVWILADLREEDLPRLRQGAAASARVAAWPGRVFQGAVDQVFAVLDPVTRTARARIGVENRDRALKPEMLAEVEIAAAPRRALAVPREALVASEGELFAWVAAGAGEDGRERFRRRRVFAAEQGDLAVVSGGLAAGERLLVEPPATREGGGNEARLSERQASEVGLRLERAGEHDLVEEIGAGGRVAFDDTRLAHVFSPVTGRVARVLAGPGDHVRKGAPLATLASPDVGSAFADAVKAEADLVAARRERDRLRELVAEHAGAPRDLEAAEAAHARAEAELARARGKLRLLAAGRHDAVAREYTVLAPVDGEVLARGAAPGLEVQGQWSGAQNAVELFTIGGLDPLWVMGDVHEMDLPGLRSGAEVTVRVPAFPERTFRGRVDFVSDVVDPVTRGVKVRCVVENRERLLRPEMAPTLTLVLPPRRQLAVPRSALLRLGDEQVVFVAAGKAPDGALRFRRRRVRVGEERRGELVAVLDGLVPGEEVVVRGGIFLVGLL